MEIYVVLLRVAILGFTVFLGCFASFMFIYRIHVISQEKKIKPQKIDGTNISTSRVTKHKEKKSSIPDSNATSSKSFWSSAFSSAKTPTAEKSPPKLDPTFEKKLEQWREKNAAALEKRHENKIARRYPAWDEIEMRRHGLVNRHCDRVYGNNCPSNPSTIDVSNEQSVPVTPLSQATIVCTLPPDSSSIYSNSNPLATSTPRSHASSSTTKVALNDEKDVKQAPFGAVDIGTLSPIPKSAPVIPSQSLTSQYAPGPLNESSPPSHHQQQQNLQYQGQQQYQAAAQEPPNQSPIQPTQLQVQGPSNPPPPQQQQQNQVYAQLPQPSPPPPQQQQQVQPQFQASLPQQEQQQNHQGPLPSADSQKPASNQFSQLTQSSLYMDPNLHNSTYAYQKPPTM